MQNTQTLAQDRAEVYATRANKRANPLQTVIQRQLNMQQQIGDTLIALVKSFRYIQPPLTSSSFPPSLLFPPPDNH